MASDKRLKHLLMSAALKMNRPLYERVRFRIMRGWWPNIDSPETINELLLKKKVSDDYDSAELSGTLEGYRHAGALLKRCLPDVICVARRAEDLKVIARLPDGNYILKGSHGSGMVQMFSISDGRASNDVGFLLKLANRWLSTDYSSVCGEHCYDRVEKVVILEKSLTNSLTPATDLKVHCANGTPRILQYIDRSDGELRRCTWTVGDDGKLSRIAMYQNESDVSEKLAPELLGQVIGLTRRLAQPFTYVRIDFFIFLERLYFAEFTHIPAGGCMPLLSKQHDQMFLETCGLKGLSQVESAIA